MIIQLSRFCGFVSFLFTFAPTEVKEDMACAECYHVVIHGILKLNIILFEIYSKFLLILMKGGMQFLHR